MLSTILVPARGDSMTMYKEAAANPDTDWTLMFIAVLGWALAFLAAFCCCQLVGRLIAVGRARQLKRTVGVQTTTTFRRRYAAPRMGELADGEHGVWID